MGTIFVERETDLASPRLGKIKGVYRQRQEGYAEEPLPEDDGEVLAFVSPVLTADEKAARALDAKERLDFEVNFDQENRIRALEGKAAITRAQYRDALDRALEAAQSLMTEALTFRAGPGAWGGK